VITPDPTTELSSAPPNEQALCLACGLCCRGVWFDSVTIAPDEVEHAERVGLTLDRSATDISFKQPCVLHQAGRCSAYGVWRPKVCVDYRCALLDKYMAGHISLEKALVHAKAARSMADELRAEVGNEVGSFRSNSFLARLNNQPADDSKAHPESFTAAAKMNTVALLIYYKNHFKNPDKSGAKALATN
jgi:hypothetical protein